MGNLSKTSVTLLDNFFMTRGLALEEKNTVGVFSLQMQLDALLSEVKNRISLQPKGLFQIKVYDEDTNEPTSLIITNCPEDEIKYEYLFLIAPDWSSFRFYQISESGLKVERLIVTI